MERSAGVIRADIEIGGAAAAAAAARTAAAGIEALAGANIAFIRGAARAEASADAAAGAQVRQVKTVQQTARELTRAAEDQARALEKAAIEAAQARERTAREAVKASDIGLRKAQRGAREAKDNLVFDPSVPATAESVVAAQKLATDADAALKAAKQASKDAKAELAASIREGNQAIALAKGEAAEKVRLGKRAAEDLIEVDKDRRSREKRNARDAIEDEHDRASAIRDTGKAAAEAAPGGRGLPVLRALDSIPKLGLDTIAKGVVTPVGDAFRSVFSGLFTSGIIPTVFSGLKGLGGIALGALSSVLGVITGIVGGLGSLAAGAVRLGVPFVVNVGRIAVTGVTTLVGWIGRGTLALAGMAAKAGLVTAGIAAAGVAAGVAFASNAIGDASRFVLSMDNAARATGLAKDKFVDLAAAARRFDVDVNDIRSSMIQFQGQIAQAARDPAGDIGAYFAKIGVATKDGDRIRTTNELLEETIRASTKLSQTERIDFLSKVFGEDDIGKFLPIFDEIVGDAEYLAKLNAKQARLGSLPTEVDRVILRAYRNEVADLSDAWTGVKLAVGRAVGPAFIQAAHAASEAMVALRGQFERFFRSGAIVFSSLLNDFRTLVAGGFEGRNDFLPDVETQKANARAMAKAYGYELRKYLTAEGAEVELIPTQTPIVNRWLIPVRNALSYVEYAFRRLKPLATSFFAALFDDKAARRDFPWLVTLKTGIFAAGRLIRETILTLGGDDKLVEEFPWLTSLRDGLFKAVRFVKEAFQVINGDGELAKEFPWLRSVRTGIEAVVGYVRRLAREIYAAVTGNDGGMTYTFKWIPVVKAAILDFVAYVKLVWADLGRIWEGGQAQTSVGVWIQALGTALAMGRDLVVGFVQTAVLLWQDLKRVFAGDIGPTKLFNFQGLNEAATGVVQVMADLKKAFSGETGDEAKFNFEWIRTAAQAIGYLGDIIKGVMAVAGTLRDAVVGVVSAVTLGLVDLSSPKLIGGIIAIALALGTARKAWLLFGRAVGFVRGLVGGGAATAAVAGAEGAAGAVAGSAVAGAAEVAVAGGVAAGLGAVGAAAAKSGEGAAKAVPLFTRLIDKFKALIALAGKFPGVAKFLGLTAANAAGGMLAESGDPNTTSGAVAGVAGGALSGAALAAMLSKNPYLIAAGAVAGGVYGYRGYADRSAQARKDANEFKATEDCGPDAEQAQLDAEIADLKSGFSNAAEAAGLAFKGIGWKGIGDKAGDDIGLGVENAVTRRFSDLFRGRGVDAGGSLGSGLSDLASSTARTTVVPRGFVDPFSGAVAGAVESQTASNKAGNTLVVNLPDGGQIVGRQTDDQYAAARATLARSF